MKRCGIYIRVSTEEQARIQEGSLVSQKNRLLEYVESQNRYNKSWGEVIEFYCDEGRSAKDMNRPEFRRLLSDVQAGRINLILATELSRLSRNIRDFCEIWDLLKKHNCSFITLRENFDTTTASGEMMVFNLINYAQYERKQTAERISANWLSRAKRGLWNGGSIPLGYDRNPNNKSELLINEEEARRVRKVFETFLAEGSIRRTQIKVTREGIYNKRYINKYGIEKGGNEFTVDTLQSLLTNVAYIGKRAVVHKDKATEYVKATWPAIIDDLTFQKVQARLHKNKNRYKPDEWKTHPFPLTELVKCHECGKSMGGKSGTGRKEKHFYYGHPQIKNPVTKHIKPKCQIKNVRALRLEEIVLKCLRDLMNNQALIERWINIYQEKSANDLPEVESRLKQMEKETQTTSKRISNLVQRIADLPADVPAENFYDQIKQMNLKLAKLKHSKTKVKLVAETLIAQEIDGLGLKQRIEKVVERLEANPKESQRPLYANLIESIEILPTKIKLNLFAPAKRPISTTEHDTGAQSARLSSNSESGFLKATGTDGAVLPFSHSKTRGGSSTVGIGAPERT